MRTILSIPVAKNIDYSGFNFTLKYRTLSQLNTQLSVQPKSNKSVPSTITPNKCCKWLFPDICCHCPTRFLQIPLLLVCTLSTSSASLLEFSSQTSEIHFALVHGKAEFLGFYIFSKDTTLSLLTTVGVEVLRLPCAHIQTLFCKVCLQN